MKILLITPQVGRKSSGKYVKTWQMEPLPIATLVGLTPSDVDIEYVDERLGEVPDYDKPYDLVAITVETNTAKRAYEISRGFTEKGTQVILGGYHVSIAPEEAQMYAPSICVRQAETNWKYILDDAEKGKLKRRYEAMPTDPYNFIMPDRSIFGKRKYFKLSCIETGRGCPLRCNFCSIAAATLSTYKARPIDQVLADIDKLKHKTVFFVEDNFVGNIKHARELLREVAGMGIRWVGQGTLTMARDKELLSLMEDSGCMGVLIGFESLKQETLALMDKNVNIKMGDFKEKIKRLHDHGVALYGTFIFGYDSETLADIDETVEKAIEFGIFMAAFNHLTPFPGTPMYHQFLKEGRLLQEKWWLDPDYRFGQVPFMPKNMTPEQLRQGCLDARRKFYGARSTTERLLHNLPGNGNSLSKIAAYLSVNGMLRKEVSQKNGLPLGNIREYPQPLFA